MKALVIAAHGSRKKESADEVAALTKKLADKATAEFDLVAHGFLQFSEPALPSVVDDIVSRGADQVVIFPFFISAGSHILTDIPELIRNCRETYPDTAFKLTRHLGAVQGIEDIILEEVTRD